MKTLLAYLFVIFLSTPFVQGQDAYQRVLASAGGTAIGSNGSLEWTLGEVVIGDLKSDTYVITQGFHQTRLSQLVLGTENLTIFNIQASIYPNPTRDLLHITIDAEETNPKIIELIDVSGKRMLYRLESGNQIEINMVTLPHGIYFLQIIDESENLIGRFKVIKL